MSASGNLYRGLADFRYEIRQFLYFSERAAFAAGLEPQQHQALLTIKGLPPGQEPSVGYLAERLQIRHHTAVELAARLEKKGLLRRSRSDADRRHVNLFLTARGERLLGSLSQAHRAELRSAGPKLLRALATTMRLRDEIKRPERSAAGNSRKRSRTRLKHS